MQGVIGPPVPGWHCRRSTALRGSASVNGTDNSKTVVKRDDVSCMVEAQRTSRSCGVVPLVMSCSDILRCSNSLGVPLLLMCQDAWQLDGIMQGNGHLLGMIPNAAAGRMAVRRGDCEGKVISSLERGSAAWKRRYGNAGQGCRTAVQLQLVYPPSTARFVVQFQRRSVPIWTSCKYDIRDSDTHSVGIR